MNEELVFARVLEEFQKVWKKRISIKNLIDNFYDVVSIPANLLNSNNYQIKYIDCRKINKCQKEHYFNNRR